VLPAIPRLVQTPTTGGDATGNGLGTKVGTGDGTGLGASRSAESFTGSTFLPRNDHAHHNYPTHDCNINLDRLGLLGFVALVIAIVGVSNILFRTWAERNKDNPLAPAVARAF